VGVRIGEKNCAPEKGASAQGKGKSGKERAEGWCWALSATRKAAKAYAITRKAWQPGREGDLRCAKGRAT